MKIVYSKIEKKILNLTANKLGIAYLTGMIWEDTIDTIMLVEVELLCTTTVAKIPIIKPASGFVKTTFDLNASEAYLPLDNNEFKPLYS